jgi:hypothetical protein
LTRTIEEIRKQEDLVISPELLRSPRATVYSSGLIVSVYSYDPSFPPTPHVGGAGLGLWFALVATGAGLWLLEQGNEWAVFAVAAATALVVYAAAHLVREIRRATRRDTSGTVHVLSISMGDENATNFFQSDDEAEVDAVRAEIERVFAGIDHKGRLQGV